MNQAGSSAVRRRAFRVRLQRYGALYVMLAPTLVFALLFQYRPYGWIQIAFRDFSFLAHGAGGMGANPWVGLRHLRAFVTGPDFYRIVRNTAAISLLALVFGFPMPILFALLVNEVRSRRFKRVVQTVTYLPHFVSWVIVAGLFYFLLDPRDGTVNRIIVALGGEPIPFFRRPEWFWPVMTVATIWKNVGWSSIIYLAAITSIDLELYEAAAIDGAGKLQEIAHVTIPGILPTVIVVLIITTGRIVTGGGIIPDFEAVFNMGNPLVSRTAESIAIHNYNQGILMGRYSYSTAVGLFQSVIAFVFVFGSNTLARKTRGYGVL